MSAEIKITDKWYVIVNPGAGSGKGLEDLPLITKLIRDNNIPYELVFSQHKYHVTELTVQAVNDGYRRIIAIGGDGTIHEVVNGLFIQQVVPTEDVTVAVIAVGTGNDWIRMFGLPKNYSEAVRAIVEGHTFLQDVGEVHYEESHFQQKRYMANMAGAGFDATVTKHYEHYKAKGERGVSLYAKAALKAYLRYKPSGVKVWVDDELVYNDLLFSLNMGICKFNGGGFNLLPNAVADDGLFDISLIKPFHWWHAAFRLRRLFDGRIYTIGHVRHFRGSRIRIESTPDIPLQVDGELLGGTPFNMSVRHRAVRVVVRREFLE